MSIYDSQKEHQMKDISFVAGTDYEIEFQFYVGINPADVANSTCKWFLSEYGQPERVIYSAPCAIKLGTNNINTFAVTIPSDITKNLYGLYLHQIELRDVEDKTIRPAQGTVNIIKAIPSI